jgi:glucans biosynthesis protein
MTAVNRREALSMFGALAALGMLPTQAVAQGFPGVTLGEGVPFDAETVLARARALAAAPYVPPPEISPEWRNLSYDAFRGIWFETRNALYRDTDGAVHADLFIAGLYFLHKIEINAVEDDMARPVVFDLDLFARTDRFPDLPPEGTGFAGLRLRGQLETRGIFQEYAVFQGASYFRAVGRDHGYGISARGLALNTAEPCGEEFPIFREFWIEAAPAGASTVTVHALLDSPSVAGAYRFVIAKGETTEMEVSATLFPRVDLPTVGIAPGTSMFLFSDINRTQFDDFREAVHDSDGLLIMNGAGETLWRPLNNPTSLQISAFGDRSPRGFGLMQRARDLRNYNDLEARYERRPSLWVEPEGDWGSGSIILVEIPTDKEINDNIVAFWRPAEPLVAGSEHRIDYRLYWCSTAPAEGAVAPVIATSTGARVFEEGRIFSIDFGAHPALGDDPDRLEVRTSTTAGAISGTVLQRNPATGGMRLDVTLVGDVPFAEMRAELWRGGRHAAEVWVNRWVAP